MLAAALDSLLNRGGAPGNGAGPAGARMLDTAGGRLRVLDTGGAGPVVVTVPDGPNVIEHHLPVIELLKPHARVICFDLPGFGYSRPSARYTHEVKPAAETVLAVLDALEVKQAALHFSCANGFYAIAAAKLAPQRIRRLLLCQTPSMDAMRAWTKGNVPAPLRLPVAGQLLNRVSRRKLANVWYSLALPDKATRPAFRRIANQALEGGGCFCLAGVVQGLLRTKAEDLAGVKQPVTMLWGDADPSHRRTRAESLLDLLPQARIEHFPGCGHFPDIERPQRYAEIALAALHA